MLAIGCWLSLRLTCRRLSRRSDGRADVATNVDDGFKSGLDQVGSRRITCSLGAL